MKVPWVSHGAGWATLLAIVVTVSVGCNDEQAAAPTSSGAGQQVAQNSPPAVNSGQPVAPAPGVPATGNATPSAARPSAPSPGARMPAAGATPADSASRGGRSAAGNVPKRPEREQPTLDLSQPQSPQMGFEVGDLAPEIMGEDLDGVPFRLSEYRGKVVVVDFWGNW